MKTLLTFFLMAFMAISSPMSASQGNANPIADLRMEERGIEVRYIKMQLAEGEALPKEIEVYGQKFPLFKNKEDAYNYVIAMPVKRDLVVVYVLTDKDEVVEFISINE